MIKSHLAIRVDGFCQDTFGIDPSAKPKTRALVFLEEALELAQAMGIDRAKALEQLEYTYSRPAGDPEQEAGGTVFTLTALLTALGLDYEEVGHASVDEAYTRQAQIIEKAKHKPKVSE